MTAPEAGTAPAIAGGFAYRVLQTDRAWPDSSIERQVLQEVGAELIEAPGREEMLLAELAGEVDAIIVNWAPVTARVIAATTRCRVISRSGIGLDNIDVPYATQRGILVTNVPDYCVNEVADHTLALLLAGARQVAHFHRQTKLGAYALDSAAPMPRLAECVLGLVGLGRIGLGVARRARSFGMRVLAHTASGCSSDREVAAVSLDELLAASDFVSLHLPLTGATRHLIGRPQLERMKRTAWLINTARGGLVDQSALAEAIARGTIAGAALDVFDPEPPDLGQPLFRSDRVIATPHAAFVSNASLVELRTRVARQVAAVLRGERPENVVNLPGS